MDHPDIMILAAMAYQSVFVQAFIYLAAALIAVVIGKRLGLGAVLGYLLIGALIGPWGLHWIGKEGEHVMHFAEFGVVVMLFLVGLELQPAKLWKMRLQIIGLGSLQVCLSALAIALVGMTLNLNWQASLAVGLIFAMSSTAIVLQSLQERGLARTEAGQQSFAVLLFQDIAVIPILALIPMLGAAAAQEKTTMKGAEDWLAAFPPWAQAVVTILAICAVVIGARWLSKPIFRAIAATRQREAFTAFALLMVIGVALLMSLVGLSPALGAFVAGVVLASSEYRHEMESDLAPFKGLLLGIFFIGVGVGIDFGHIAQNLPLVCAAAAAVLTIKGAVLFGLGAMHRNSVRSSSLLSAALAGGGEFAFVLIALALSSHVFSEEIARTLIAVVAITMACTPLLMMLATRLGGSAEAQTRSQREPDVEDEHSPVIICGFGRFGHAVGRLLRAQGFQCTVLDHDEDQVDLVRSFGIPVFYGDASRPDLLTAAGAASAKILIIALKEAETTANIIRTAQHNFPHLKLFIRAHSRLESYDYLEIGEDRIYRDTLDSSLTMASDALRELGVPANVALRAAKLYRKRDELMLREMAKHRHDRAAYTLNAREAIAALNELMKHDQVEIQSDDGWTPPSANPDRG